MLKQSQQFGPDAIDPTALTVEHQPLKLGSSQLLVIRFCHSQKGTLTWTHIADLLVQSLPFRMLWNQTWADLPVDFMWKPVPIHPAFVTTHPFFVAIAPSSFRLADADAYRTHLNRLPEGQHVATFQNLSGESTLITPEDTGAYGHIRAFCRLAPEPLWDELWQQVGVLAQEAIAHQSSIWCNTHGHGVPWVHIRFDPTHKYAVFPPYGPISNSSQQQWYKTIYIPAFGGKKSLLLYRW
ncbi:MAG: hypothetical protein AAGD25_26235 [Cyanobacteria bacterium P01_F01_bin.150]